MGQHGRGGSGGGSVFGGIGRAVGRRQHGRQARYPPPSGAAACRSTSTPMWRWWRRAWPLSCRCRCDATRAGAAAGEDALVDQLDPLIAGRTSVPERDPSRRSADHSCERGHEAAPVPPWWRKRRAAVEPGSPCRTGSPRSSTLRHWVRSRRVGRTRRSKRTAPGQSRAMHALRRGLSMSGLL